MDLRSSVSRMFNSETTAFRDFASHYDLVYFGRIHQEDDDQHIVRGVTASNKHTDEHYCVGTAHGFDIVMLKRTDILTQPNSNHTEKYSWIIMQFDLRSQYDYPHVFLDGGHHNELFYQTLFVKFARLMKVDKSLFGEASKTFNTRFTSYTPPDSLDLLPEIVKGDIGETMAAHFGHLDFEWFQDRLLVYSTGSTPTKHLLEHMLRAGLWLSEVLDTNGKKQLSAHSGADMHRDQIKTV